MGGRCAAVTAEQNPGDRREPIVWCGREDSNFHGLSATTTSTLRVYQFRHDRTRDIPPDGAGAGKVRAPSRGFSGPQHAIRSAQPSLPAKLSRSSSAPFGTSYSAASKLVLPPGGSVRVGGVIIQL